jgi:thiol-disulfide isomerase/thioredoxin
MKRQITGLLLAASTVLPISVALAGSPTFILDAETVIREGAGPAREKANALELEPAKVKWDGLKDWANGSAVSADSLRGKPALIVFWTAWAPASQSALKRAVQLAAEHKDVTVIAVHADQNYELATKWLTDNKMSVLSARDAGGAMRKALLSDQDPDIYVIDRAGQLRYADIETPSLGAALTNVSAETVELAQGKPAEAKKLEADYIAGKNRTVVAGEGVRPGDFGNVDVEFKKPEAGAYEKALWPEKNKTENIQGSTDSQGNAVPFSLDHGHWFTAVPKTAGKVIVYDYWATWSGPCKRAKPLFEEMTNSFRNELAVVAISGVAEKRPEVQRWLDSNRPEFSHVFDNDEKAIKALNVTSIPTVLVVSSDGVVRWQGNPHQRGFRDIVRQVIEVDPGVQARRRAIQDLIKKTDAEARERAAKAK